MIDRAFAFYLIKKKFNEQFDFDTEPKCNFNSNEHKCQHKKL